MDAPFYVLVLQVDYTSIDDVPHEPLAEHVARSRQWHAMGVSSWPARSSTGSGADTDNGGRPTHQDAEEFAAGDPFVIAGSARVTSIRPWADILGLA